MKTAILVKTILICVLLCTYGYEAKAFHGGNMSEAEKIYIKLALLGDLSDLETTLSSAEGAEAVMKSFNAKFVDKLHGINLDSIKDPLIRQVMKLHLNYWRQALLTPDKLEKLEQQLKAGLVKIANENLIPGSMFDFESMQAPMTDYIKNQGYGVLIFGRTLPLFELMLWKKNEDHQYTVILTDSSEKVNVTHIGDFISGGWSSYATHGVASTGGWATKEQLFCVCESYQLDSEKFLVSYLKHEGRHFADYKKYPNLQSASLEYRAKLTELSFAEKTSHNLLTEFEQNAVANTQVGHSLANWHVVKNMSDRLGLLANPDVKIDWAKIDVQDIQQAARQLLKKSDQELIKLGALNTQNIIFPAIR